MGQARARRREIEELKRTNKRMVATPWPDSPVLVPFDRTWLITDKEFGAALAIAQDRPVTPEAVVGTLQELARLSLWAERSGVKEDVCQAWFAFHQEQLFMRARGDTDSKSFMSVLG
jgi:hypothetical protein